MFVLYNGIHVGSSSNFIFLLQAKILVPALPWTCYKKKKFPYQHFFVNACSVNKSVSMMHKSLFSKMALAGHTMMVVAVEVMLLGMGHLLELVLGLLDIHLISLRHDDQWQ